MFLFIFERDRDRAQVREVQRGTQNPKQAPGSELSAQPDAEPELRNREIMT